MKKCRFIRFFGRSAMRILRGHSIIIAYFSDFGNKINKPFSIFYILPCFYTKFCAREYDVIVRKNRRKTKYKSVLHIPCGEIQEVFYELLLIREYHPLDPYRFACPWLERRFLLLERAQRLRTSDYRRPVVLPLQKRNTRVYFDAALQLFLWLRLPLIISPLCSAVRRKTEAGTFPASVFIRPKNTVTTQRASCYP